MVAIRSPHPDLHDDLFLDGVAPAVAAPSLRLAPPPARRRPAVPALDRATVFRRRRLMALVFSTLVVVGLVASLDYLTSLSGADGTPAPLDARPADSPVNDASTAGAGAVADGDAYVVQPGDTFWSIAAEVAPGEDPRPVVDRLQDANGGGALQAGDRLVIDLG
jgi:nucleoid-associated protein YgaU